MFTRPLAPARGLLGLALLLAPVALADEPAPAPAALSAAQQDAWAVRMARMEGASTNVEEAAEELVRTARRIAEGGRVTALSDLASDAVQLNRKVVSLSLATGVMAEAN